MTLTAQSFALFFTVALLAVTVYFLLGSLPLWLVLNHDNPVDAGFIRSFYTTYYRFALVTAVGTAICYALAHRTALATGASAIAVMTVWLRAKFLPKMAQLAPLIQSDGALAIAAFRKIHRSALLINTGQLLAILGSLAAI
jgi:hypothetical protein